MLHKKVKQNFFDTKDKLRYNYKEIFYVTDLILFVGSFTCMFCGMFVLFNFP